MNPCEEYELLLSARLDGALSLKEETQLHAHLAQCPPLPPAGPGAGGPSNPDDLPLGRAPDSLKDALASQDWSKSASSSPPRSPTASPSSDGTCFRGWPALRPPWCWLWAFASFSCQGEQMDSCQRQSLKSFSGPSRTPPLAARKAIPPPPTTQTARKTLRRIQSSRQNRTEETPRGRPRPLRTGPPPQTTRRTRSPRPITTKPPTTPPIPPVIPPQGTPAQTHLPTTTQGTNPTIPPPRGEPAGSPVAAHGLSGPAGTDPHPGAFGLQSQPRLLALFRPGCQRQRRHVPDGLLLHRTDSRDSRPAVLHGARTGITGRK